MVDTAREQQVVSAVPTGLLIGGQWRPAASGATFKVEDPSTGSVLTEVADASPADGMQALDAATKAQPGWAAFPPRERSEILRGAYELLLERQDDLALLMTLEMGKPLADARGEITYAAEFFRWFSEEAVRIDGGYAVAPSGQGRFLVMRQPVGPCLLDHAMELPDGDGHPQDRPGCGSGMHDGRQAGRADPVVDAGARRHPAGGRPARRRPQPDHDLGRGRRDGADDSGRPGPQAVLHRVDRGRAQAARAVRGPGDAYVHGTGRQRPVPGLRGRRSRCSGRGSHARQDAQHGRGLHRGKPVLRALLGGRRVRSPARRADVGAARSAGASRTAWWSVR